MNKWLRIILSWIIISILISPALAELIKSEEQVEMSDKKAKSSDIKSKEMEEKSDLIPLDKIKMYAKYVMFHHAIGIDPSSEFMAWRGADIGDPRLIYDINGEPLIYDVPVVKEGKVVGIIEIWAHKTKGVPIVRLIITPAPPEFYDDHIQKVRERAEGIALESAPQESKISSNLICYRYPRMGIMSVVKVDGKIVKKIIVDVGTLEIVPEEKVKPYPEPKEKDIAKRLEMWKTVDDSITNGIKSYETEDFKKWWYEKK